MDERLSAKRKMFDELVAWARGKGMEKFKPKAVVEETRTIVAPNGADSKALPSIDIDDLGTAGTRAPAFRGMTGDQETPDEGAPEGGMEEPGEEVDPEELARLLR